MSKKRNKKVILLAPKWEGPSYKELFIIGIIVIIIIIVGFLLRK